MGRSGQKYREQSKERKNERRDKWSRNGSIVMHSPVRQGKGNQPLSKTGS